MLNNLNYIYNIIQSFSSYLIIGNIFLTLILLIILISTRMNFNKLFIRYTKFFKNSNDSNIEKTIEENIDLCYEITRKNKDIEGRIAYIERNMIQCVQKIGVVRYNAFDNVGSNLSFAIALLDGNDNGIVLNGIYSRESTSTYAKAIISGQSKYTLSAEEIQAIDIAKKNRSF